MNLDEKLKSWAKSPKGKAKIDAARKDALKAGKAFGSRKGSGGAGFGAGTGPASATDLAKYKKEFIRILREKIQDAGYDFAAPENLIITSTFNDSTGYYEIHINFNQESIYRESLYPENHPDGAYDIVALLNHGYDTPETSPNVYGYWAPAGKVIAGLRDREGLFYIQKAAETFEQLYGDTVHVSYNEKYDKRG